MPVPSLPPSTPDEAWTGDLTKAARDLAPIVVTTVIAWGVALAGERVAPAEYVISAALALASATIGTLASLRGRVRAGTMVAAIVYLSAIGVLRDAGGGSSSGVSVLALLAVLQTALYSRRRRELAVVLAAVAALFLVPILVFGPPHYPRTGYRSALLSVLVYGIVGLVTQRLVEDIRGRSSESRRRVRMLVRVNDTVHQLFESDDVRRDLCAAVKEISHATAVFLYEATVEREVLWCSASTLQHPAAARGSLATAPSGLFDAFQSGQRVLVTEDAGGQTGNHQAWVAAGSPPCVLYQPLKRADLTVGVMVVTWDELLELSDTRVTMASLLAHEGAAVISHVDVVLHLTDEAHTDPLTGLPNRRAWDERLRLAFEGPDPFAVALLDIDHFKQFNDRRGHPEGDRLLREAAERWRSETRPVDFLARVGGEEFALLIQGAQADSAVALLERLRALMPDAQTCSAGIAFRARHEPAAALVERADRALYEAKAAGRDRTCMSAGTSDAQSPGAADVTGHPG